MINDLISKVKSGDMGEFGTNIVMDVTKSFTPISSEDLFKVTFTQSIKIKKSSAEALDFALGVEIKARDYYAELGRMAPNSKVKNFFEILEKFEDNHVEIIKDTITYMKDKGIYI